MWQDDRPIYLQIRDIIVTRILGNVHGDGPLPSVRALAAELDVNPLTVAKAYQELQIAGLVVAKKGVGLYVELGARQSLLKSERANFLTSEWPRIRRRLVQLGLTSEDLFEQA